MDITGSTTDGGDGFSHVDDGCGCGWGWGDADAGGDGRSGPGWLIRWFIFNVCVCVCMWKDDGLCEILDTRFVSY